MRSSSRRGALELVAHRERVNRLFRRIAPEIENYPSPDLTSAVLDLCTENTYVDLTVGF